MITYSFQVFMSYFCVPHLISLFTYMYIRTFSHTIIVALDMSIYTHLHSYDFAYNYDRKCCSLIRQLISYAESMYVRQPLKHQEHRSAQYSIGVYDILRFLVEIRPLILCAGCILRCFPVPELPQIYVDNISIHNMWFWDRRRLHVIVEAEVVHSSGGA